MPPGTGIFHVRLHVQRAQGLRYKFNNRWLTEKSRAFFLGGQTADNVFYSIVSGGGIWSAYEVLTLWAGGAPLWWTGDR